ncbi:unnamed protein product [Tetraodon nigroviridis]|uniref:(spotted green pufferfish) hypothetical protein n=1 Tax=Tetraodon nigroviridis TaxID=99883 RepID=Q4SF30_TETNG|nr:unnamed protein product [Tetraodon nigroviridis]
MDPAAAARRSTLGKQQLFTSLPKTPRLPPDQCQSHGIKRGSSPTVTAGAARRRPLSHHTDPGARRRWSKINVPAIPEMPLFKSQRRGEERG